ncbi:CD9 antigen-like isoform X1 [Solea senegalensis]|uniref:CD9 antigen-like isoform X1 n=1 Tax=Solea senegalensis TaxID=28829 RepID=A0AAV6RJV5_SOLSE|nr:CD9 antigen isoform X1 [Solea senegalensis]KAG7504784.1 CD9 antigen-like isoform X1 [Solea senegalensis]
MALDGCGIVCKYILVLFNLIFAIVGFAFLGLGLWLRFSENTRGIFEIQSLNSSAFVMGVTVLITLGSVMLIVVAFGDYGACNEKRCSLVVFSVLLVILAVAEVLCGLLAYTQRNAVGNSIAEFYVSMYALYVKGNGDPAIGVTLTFIHNLLGCCGVTGFKLIELAQQTCPQAYISSSCPGVISNVFDSNASLVMSIFLGTGALLIIALICSITLSCKIRLSASTPQYIILTQSTSVPRPSEQELVSTAYSHLDQDPVIFTPLTVANIPIAQT